MRGYLGFDLQGYRNLAMPIFDGVWPEREQVRRMCLERPG